MKMIRILTLMVGSLLGMSALAADTTYLCYPLTNGKVDLKTTKYGKGYKITAPDAKKASDCCAKGFGSDNFAVYRIDMGNKQFALESGSGIGKGVVAGTTDSKLPMDGANIGKEIEASTSLFGSFSCKL